ncbi:hypothetical protein L596_014228 [Steinernema carpocapsae]|uniref:Uncharacterized protein n=1 Tax=Steinernema carpocapsae TaxID=34508 RepID=A0A4U5NB82_STECR|nr:hypothetical protein L596_014228 [Steinernema carpocapsae]
MPHQCLQTSRRVRQKPRLTLQNAVLFLAIVFCASIILCTLLDCVPCSFRAPKNATNFIARRQNSNLLASLPNYKPDLSSILIATATSVDHFIEMLRFCRNFVNNRELASHPNLRLVIYNLGDLNEDQIKAVNETCGGAEIRDFQFDRYPTFVKNLKQYRWKPVIISETLMESDVVIWADSSTEFGGGSETFESLIEEISKSNITMRLIGNTYLSIFRATHERMYSYLPIPPEKAKALKMYGALTIIWVKTPRTQHAVLYPWVECALDAECMAPRGAQPYCWMGTYPEPQYAFCHRYDQSAINIILANAANFDGRLYQSDSLLMTTSRIV